MSIRDLAQEGNRTKPPSVFRDTPADNIAALRDWHQQHHHAASWADCVWAPCNVTTPNFRNCWDAK